MLNDKLVEILKAKNNDNHAIRTKINLNWNQKIYKSTMNYQKRLVFPEASVRAAYYLICY